MNRRDFLKSSTLAATAALGSPKLLWGSQAAKPENDPNYGLASISGIIDWHTHYISPTEIQMLKTRTERPYAVTNEQGTFIYTPANATGAGGTTTVLPRHTDLDARIAVLDQYSIKRQIVGWTIPYGYDDGHLPADFLKEMFTGWNNDLAVYTEKYPDRYSGLAALTTADIPWSVQELERTHDEYGFIGGSLPLNACATLDGLKMLKPIFDKAKSLHSHIMFHRGAAHPSIPGQPTLYAPTDIPWARSTLNTYYQLTAATLTLGLSPFLDDYYPEVSVLAIMLGGFISFVMDSIQKSGISRGLDPLQLFERIYIDSGGPYNTLPQEVAKTVEVFGADRILLGLDYGPMADIGVQISGFNSADLTLQERRQIMVDNGVELLAAKGVIA